MASQVTVHRCRFVDFAPSAVCHLARSDDGKWAALARANGSIEIFNVEFGWFQDRILPGSPQLVARRLVWVPPVIKGERPRLFSCGANARLIEWDLDTLVPKHASDSYGGAVFDMSLSPDKTTIALAVQDGSIRLFDVSEPSTIQYKTALMAHKTRALSVAWSPDGTTLASGGSDSTIRLYSVAQGRSYMRINVATIDKDTASLVWNLAFLNQATLVSGDSLGNVHFWDTEFGTLAQTVHKHKSDILALSVRDSKTVYVSGADNKVLEICKVDEEEDDELSGKWIVTQSVRTHSHDVTSIVSLPKSPCFPFGQVVTGGVDTQLCVFANNKFDESHFKVSPFAQRRQVHCSVQKRPVVLAQHARHLQLFRLGKVKPAGGAGVGVVGQDSDDWTPHEHLLDLKLSGAHNIVTSAISPCGRYIACSDVSGVRLWHIDADTHAVKRTDLSKQACAAYSLCFSSTGLLCMGGISGQIQLWSLADKRIVGAFSQHEGTLGERGGLVTALAVSTDGKWLASADRDNRVYVFALHPTTESNKSTLHSTLPVFDEPVSSLTFSPSGAQVLVTCATNVLHTWDVQGKQLGQWSKSADNLARLRTTRLCRARQHVFGASFNPAAGGKDTKLVVQSHEFFTAIDLDQPVPLPASKKRKQFVNRAARRKAAKAAKQQSGLNEKIWTNGGHDDDSDTENHHQGDNNGDNDSSSTSARNFRWIGKYKPLLCADFVSDDTMVVVEASWLRIMQAFPDTLQRKRYGV